MDRDGILSKKMDVLMFLIVLLPLLDSIGSGIYNVALHPRYWIQGSNLMVPDSKRSVFWDSGFLDLESRFRRVGFKIPSPVPKPEFAILKNKIPDT